MRSGCKHARFQAGAARWDVSLLNTHASDCYQARQPTLPNRAAYPANEVRRAQPFSTIFPITVPDRLNPSRAAEMEQVTDPGAEPFVAFSVPDWPSNVMVRSNIVGTSIPLPPDANVRWATFQVVGAEAFAAVHHDGATWATMAGEDAGQCGRDNSRRRRSVCRSQSQQTPSRHAGGDTNCARPMTRAR